MYYPVNDSESKRLLDTSTRPETSFGVIGGPRQGYANAFEHNRKLQTNREAMFAMRKVLTSPAVYVGADAWMSLMLSPTWRIRPADESAESLKYADHIGACLGIGQPPALGVPWEVRLESLLSPSLFGFGVWELVCKNVNGVWYTDIQSRDQASIAAFIVDANDKVVAVDQTPVYGWSSSIATIPASRILHIVHRPRGDGDFCGLGMLRACEPEYGDRVALSQLAIAGAQRWALQTPVIKPNQEMVRDLGLTPEQVQTEINDAQLMLKAYTSSEQAYLILPSFLEIDTFGGDISAPQALDSMIDSRDRRMLTVFLQQWLMLGSANAGGSYSLGETHVRAGEEHAAQTLTRLCRNMSSYIERAVKWQFGDVSRLKLPAITFDGLNSETFVQKLEALTGLVSSGILTPDDKMEDDVRRALEFKSERSVERTYENRMKLTVQPPVESGQG